MMLRRFALPPLQKLLYGLFVCFCLACGIELLRRGLPGYLAVDWANCHEGDWLADWRGAQLFRIGMSPFTQEGLNAMGHANNPFGHAPPAPFVFLPFTDLPKALVAEFAALSGLMLLPIHIYLTTKELKFPAPVATTALATAAVVSTMWMHYHFDAIQSSELIAFLYVLAWWSLRRRMDVRAGLLIGFAATLKLYPGLMIFMLLAARRFRAFLAASTVFVGVALYMTRVYGIHGWIQFAANQGPIAHNWMGNMQNTSLYGLVARVLSPFHPDTVQVSPRFKAIAIVISIVLVALSVWVCWGPTKRAKKADPSAIDLPFVLFSLLSAFLNAWAWEHYFCLILQPMFVLLAVYWRSFHATLREFCDNACSARKLFTVAAVSAFAIGVLFFLARVLSVNYWTREQFAILWRNHHLPFYYQQLHVIQVATYSPWIVVIVLCFGALLLSWRLKLAGRSDQRNT
jgi:hypothetical protein